MREISLNARLAAEEANSAEIEVVLIKIEHEDLDEPIKLSTDNTETISEEPLIYGTRSSWMADESPPNPFLFCIASVILPSDEEEGQQPGQIVISNVDNDVSELLQSVVTRATVHMAVVLADTPGTVEAQFRDLQITDSSCGVGTISLTVSREPIFRRPWPGYRMTRQSFVSLFR